MRHIVPQPHGTTRFVEWNRETGYLCGIPHSTGHGINLPLGGTMCLDRPIQENFAESIKMIVLKCVKND